MLPKGKAFHPDEQWYNIPIIDNYSKLKPAPGEIGMEIECEGFNLFKTPISYWRADVDHSLRDYEGHPPIEYVLKKPIARKDVKEALKYLIDKLEAEKSFVAESSRTSVHVHINCQSMTMKQITTYVCLWMIFENLLTDFCGSTRVGNLFCLRAKDAEGFVMAYEEAIRGGGAVREELFNENYRYYGCNMASIGKYGSLEFRTMRGTVDPALICLWVDILCHLKDLSFEYDDPQAVVKDFESTRPEAFLIATFPQQKFHSAVKKDNYHQKMWEGVRLMRDIAYAIREWKHPLPLLDVVIPRYHPDDPRGTPIAYNEGNKTKIIYSPVWGSLSLDPGRTIWEKKTLPTRLRVLITRSHNIANYRVEYDSTYSVPATYEAGACHSEFVKELVSGDGALATEWQQVLPSFDEEYQANADDDYVEVFPQEDD